MDPQQRRAALSNMVATASGGGQRGQVGRQGRSEGAESVLRFLSSFSFLFSFVLSLSMVGGPTMTGQAGPGARETVYKTPPPSAEPLP